MRQSGKTEFQKLYEKLALHHFNGGSFEFVDVGPYVYIRLINKKNSQFPCQTENCPGDGRYAAPGRRHREGCEWPVLLSDAGTIEKYLTKASNIGNRNHRLLAELLAANQPGGPDPHES